jgi:hypothetical protein
MASALHAETLTTGRAYARLMAREINPATRTIDLLSLVENASGHVNALRLPSIFKLNMRHVN